MAKAYLFGLMVKSMKVSFRMINCKVKVHSFMRMETNILASSRKVKDMAKAYLLGLMVRSMKVSTTMVEDTVKEKRLYLMER